MILVVEDEALIRLETVSLLEDAGYPVIEARDADVAIQILESRSDIRVVFTDIMMPGSVDGLRLANAVKDRWPPILILVTSGLSAPTEEQIPKIARFLRKPYAPQHVLKAIDELLDINPEPYRYLPNLAQSYGRLV